MCNQPDIPAAAAHKNAKIAENILDKKSPTTGISTTGIAAPALGFLQAEKQKQVPTIGLTDLQLLASH